MRHYRYEMTCSGCPEQYDVWDNDTRVAYIRYRWGYLRVCPYKPEKFEVTNEYTGKKSIEQEIDWDTTLYERSIGDGLRGILPDKQRSNILDEIDNYIWKYWKEGTYIDTLYTDW